MLKLLRTLALGLAGIIITGPVAQSGENTPISAADPVSFRDVRIEDGFWAQRQKVLIDSALPHAFEKMRPAFEDFARAAGLMKGPMRGGVHADSLSFNVMNAAAYTLAWHPDPELKKQLNGYIDWIEAAMEPDGYINLMRKLASKEQLKNLAFERWVNLRFSHEEIVSAYLFEAACSYHEATGDTKFLDMARRNAGLWVRGFRPGGLNYLTGHEAIKMALVRLYKDTGEHSYFDCAQYLLDNRCAPREKLKLDRRDYPESYFQAHLPVREQREVVGHQVRAMFLYTAMADIAMETGDTGLIKALEALWTDFVSHKMYIHGGSNGVVESYGPPYFLPNDKRAYCETCAAVGTVFWGHRMALLLRDAKYADVMERALLNNVLGGIALDGKAYNYCNPLEAAKDVPANKDSMRRAPWLPLPCCPPNTMRLLASLGQYFYAKASGTVYVNLYGGATGKLKVDGTAVKLAQETKYPWEGLVKLKVEPSEAKEFALYLRIPGWAQGRPVDSDLYRYEDATPSAWTVLVNGQIVQKPVLERGYAVLKRTWKPGDEVELNLPMPVRRVLANEKVEADRGRAAYERGPAVYCAEGTDNKLAVKDLKPALTPWKVEFRPELLGGVAVLRNLEKDKLDTGLPEEDRDELTLVPYFAWGNRDAGDMMIWLQAH